MKYCSAAGISVAVAYLIHVKINLRDRTMAQRLLLA